MILLRFSLFKFSKKGGKTSSYIHNSFPFFLGNDIILVIIQNHNQLFLRRKELNVRMKLNAKPSLDADGPSIHLSWKDSSSLRVVWEFTEETMKEIEERFLIPISELTFVVRLYDVTEREIKQDGLDQYVDFHINYSALEWILYGIENSRTYCVELGVRMIGGRYYSLKRSNDIAPEHE